MLQVNLIFLCQSISVNDAPRKLTSLFLKELTGFVNDMLHCRGEFFEINSNKIRSLRTDSHKRS